MRSIERGGAELLHHARGVLVESEGAGIVERLEQLADDGGLAQPGHEAVEALTLFQAKI